MGAIKDTIDFNKELLGAIKNHQKNEDKDRYIYTLEDLSTKLCLENEQIKKENEKLKKKIYEYEHPKIVLNENHIKILKYLKYRNNKSMREILQAFDYDIDIEIAINELLKNRYITYRSELHYEPRIGSVERKLYCLSTDSSTQIKILNAIKKYDLKADE